MASDLGTSLHFEFTARNLLLDLRGSAVLSHKKGGSITTIPYILVVRVLTHTMGHPDSNPTLPSMEEELEPESTTS